ncbi:hypothetical protein RND81_11G208300 [Saponaria officinalis]|uniref:Mitogen-activated protein kinase n=1 Tax=Saponaria officinalis TaxID=3572 RepID=A0AAW1HNV1_SAPOF
MTTTMMHKKNTMNYNYYNTTNNNDNDNDFHCFTMSNTIFEVDTKYVPITGIGSGSYGVVCSSVDTMTNEKVAIKKIANVFSDEVDALRTLRELKILRHVRHENVIGLRDVVISSSSKNYKDVYLVYELMDCDLHNIIKSPQPLSADHVKYFMFQLLRGLNYLHSANILHRDLKPKNLLVNANCDLKICDFGLARTNKGPTEPMTEYVVTRWYRAPELLLQCDKYGPSIDVWAVGCILAELLGRKPIFPGKDVLGQLKLIIDFVGTQHSPNLSFITNERAYKFIKSLPYSFGKSTIRLFPGSDPLALDLMCKMLTFDPRKRITVDEALEHPYLSELYDPDLFQPAPYKFDLDMDCGIGVDKIRTLIWGEMLLYKPRPNSGAAFGF